MNNVVSLENVVLTRDSRRVVNGISCCIRENEQIMFCGGSDSGKNALMRLIAGMEKPSAGSVWVLNQAVHEMSNAKAAAFRNKHIGLIQRAAGFMERLTVIENVCLPLVIRGVGRNRQSKAAADLLNMLGIRHLAQALPAHLTDYEERIACIARALITKPKILLLNEVTSRLSARDAEKMMETIRVMAQFGEYTMLWFTDSMEKMIGSHRTIGLENGRIREDIK